MTHDCGVAVMPVTESAEIRRDDLRLPFGTTVMAVKETDRVRGQLLRLRAPSRVVLSTGVNLNYPNEPMDSWPGLSLPGSDSPFELPDGCDAGEVMVRWRRFNRWAPGVVVGRCLRTEGYFVLQAEGLRPRLRVERRYWLYQVALTTIGRARGVCVHPDDLYKCKP